MIGDMFVSGLAAGAYVIGLLFVLGLFALVVYAVCCAFAYAFGEEGEEDTSSAPAGHRSGGLPTRPRWDLSTGQIPGRSDPLKGKALTWDEIEARFADTKP